MSAASPGATRAAWLAVMPLAFVLLWSTGFIVAKAAAPHAPPLTFLLYRFAGVVVLLLPIVWLMRAPWPATARAWWLTAAVGVLLQATYLGGVWAAIALGMPAGVSSLLVGTQPLLTAVAGATVGERVTRVQWLGLLLGIFGIALVLSDRLTLSGVGRSSPEIRSTPSRDVTPLRKSLCSGPSAKPSFPWKSVKLGSATSPLTMFADCRTGPRIRS